MNFVHIHPSIGGQAERINLPQFSVCINPKCRAYDWWWLNEKHSPQYFCSSQWYPLMIYQCCLLKDSCREPGRFQVKCQCSCYLALKNLFKSAVVYHSMQWKHSNKPEFKDPKIKPFLSEPQEWGIDSFFNWPLRRVLLLTFSTSGNTAAAHVHCGWITRLGLENVSSAAGPWRWPWNLKSLTHWSKGYLDNLSSGRSLVPCLRGSMNMNW